MRMLNVNDATAGGDMGNGTWAMEVEDFNEDAPFGLSGVAPLT